MQYHRRAFDDHAPDRANGTQPGSPATDYWGSTVCPLARRDFLSSVPTKGGVPCSSHR
jgi:hypothetical protein